MKSGRALSDASTLAMLRSNDDVGGRGDEPRWKGGECNVAVYRRYIIRHFVYTYATTFARALLALFSAACLRHDPPDLNNGGFIVGRL